MSDPIQQISAEFEATIDSLTFQRYERIVLKLPKMDVLSILEKTMHPVSVYWKDKSQEIAGVGVAYQSDNTTIADLQKQLSSWGDDLTMVGGQAFPSEKKDKDTCWQGWPESRWILPLFEFKEVETHVELKVHCCPQQAVDSRVYKQWLKEQWYLLIQQKATPSPSFLDPIDTPDRGQWDMQFKNAENAFEQGLKKVVLARKKIINAQFSVNPYQLLSHLKTLNPSGYQYGIQLADENVFLGNSPELLLHSQGKELTTVAIAGTRKRGLTQAEDQSIQSQLTSSTKDIEEHHVVQAAIQDALSPLCDSVTVTATETMKLTHLQHIKSSIQAKIKSGVSIDQILASIHPTPAVGGEPKSEAIQFIQEVEPFSRGWFTGAVGAISSHAVSLCVAIRSARIMNKSLHLFAGAGIMPQSSAQSEWDEISAKFVDYLTFIQPKTLKNAE